MPAANTGDSRQPIDVGDACLHIDGPTMSRDNKDGRLEESTEHQGRSNLEEPQSGVAHAAHLRRITVPSKTGGGICAAVSKADGNTPVSLLMHVGPRAMYMQTQRLSWEQGFP